MTLEEVKALLSAIDRMTAQEVEARLAEIAETVEKRSADLTPELMNELEKVVDALKERRKVLKEAAEKRTSILESIAEGRTAGNVISRMTQNNSGMGNKDEDGADPYATMEYRRAFMNYALRGTPVPIEYRMEGTTATTDVGSVIPSPVLNRIIEKMESVGMILPRVTRTAHRGGLRVPNSSVKPVATWVAEGDGSPRQKKPTGEMIFAYHKLRCAVAATLEVDTMAIPAFEAALVNNVVEAMVTAIENAIIRCGVKPLALAMGI